MLPVKKQINAIALFALLVLSGSPIYAEDTEIYFSNPENGGEANIIMMLDTSGSMDTNNCVEFAADGTCLRKNKRLDELKTALNRVVDALSSNAHIGIGRYNRNDGGRLLYPVRGLDEIDFDGTTKVFMLNDAGDANDDPSEAIDHGADTEYLPNDREVNSVTGFIFQKNNIPRQAAVTSAYIEVLAAQNSSVPTPYEYWYETTSSPELFDASEILDPDRARSATTWSGGIKGQWYQYGTYRIDVTGAVKEALSQPFWCGGGDLALYLSHPTDVSSDRLIYMRDAVGVSEGEAASAYAPRLIVNWDASVDPTVSPAGPSYEGSLACRKKMRFGLGSALDDAHDDGTELDNQDTDVELQTDGVVGLRFTRIPYDLTAAAGNPDVVNGARLYLQGDNNNKAFTISVRAVQGDAVEFGTTAGSIKGLSGGAEVATYLVPKGTFADRHVIDIANVVREAMADPAWARNGSLALLLTATADASIDAFEGGASNAAYIELDVSATSVKSFVPRVRDKIKEIASELTADGNTPSMEAYSEMARYYLGENYLYAKDDVTNNNVGLIAGSSQYDTPITTGECSSNNIVLLTDGAPTNDADYSAVTSLTGQSACRGGLNGIGGSYNCQTQLASWLYDGDKNGMGVPISTHTIAFTDDEDIGLNMKRVADAGHGLFKAARNAKELQAAFEDIINSVTVDNASMAAPGVAVNQLNRFQHLDQLYYGTFKPATKTFWEGNVKRYRLDYTDPESPVIVDRDGNAAVDSATGFFVDSSRSFWGPDAAPADGADAILGGARNEVGSRKLLVSTLSPGAQGSATSTTKVTGTAGILLDTYNDVSAEALGLPASATTSDRTELVNFLLNSWGDPLHSEPVLVNYGFTGTAEQAASDPSRQDNTVFVGANDGMLHAVDTADGSEHFSFMVAEELAKTADRSADVALAAPGYARSTYGLDGGLTIWRRSNVSGNGAEHVYLYVGQRRGGNHYYAIDATDRDAPKLMWSIEGGSADFPKLGQTWSKPTLTQVKMNGVKVPVLVFGGGYSPVDHDTAGTVSSSDATGNAIYIVNAYTGAKLWSVSSSGATVGHADMKWSIPAQISVIDINFDGVMDHIYATDLGGQIFRADFNSSSTGAADLAYRVVTLAKLGRSEAGGVSNDRRFFAPPVPALGTRDGAEVVHVVVGSGYRAHPINKDTTDRLFVVDDEEILTALKPNPVGYTAPAVIGTSDLTDVGVTNTIAGKGWYYTFGEPGEKVVSAVAVINNQILVTTYLPEGNSGAGADACASTIGGARLYIAVLGDGSLPPGNTTLYKELNLAGLPPGPQVLAPPPPALDDGSGTGGTGSGGAGGGAGDCTNSVVIVGTQAVPGGCLNVGGTQRTRWYELENSSQADAALDAASGANVTP